MITETMWISASDTLPEERKRVQMIVEYEYVKTLSGRVLPKHEVVLEGWYENTLGWFKKPGIGHTHIGEAVRDGKVIKWRYP